MSEAVKGKLFAWGAGHTGMSGHGPGEDVLYPQPIPGLPEVCMVDAGESSAYCIDTDGRVWSWGWDAFDHLLGRGQVGYDPPMLHAALRAMGHEMTERMPDDGGVGLPARIEGLPEIKSIAAGETVFALSADGEVWAWGAAAGLGTDTEESASTPQRIPALSDIVQISASMSGQAFYALDASGRLWSWGNGHEGDLGRGKPRFDAQPGVVTTLENVRSVHAGSFHCWALLDDGSVWFWGNGDGFEIMANGSYVINEPVNIEELDGTVDLFVGPDACVARRHSGETHALGFRMEDMLGVEFGEERIARVEICDKFRCFSIGSDHGLAIDERGRLFSFGDAGLGALGNGDGEEQSFHLPAPVDGMDDVKAMKAGHNCSFAIVAGD